ncbi:MAG: hypothetical protein HZC01_04635 [Candidatus Kerfeldbacteria bacterium]|nr:hypothetical protein [Candidatus Kerfeldbacteria bacterium]
MKNHELTCLSEDALLDLLILPNQVKTVEEELKVLAELATRFLTIRQQLIVRRKMTPERRQYNYGCLDQDDPEST